MTPTAPGPSARADVATAARAALPRPDARTLVTLASVAAAVLAATSTGSLVVVALLVGIGTLDRRSGATVLLAATAVSIRFGTTTLDHLAGIQSVLGPAVAVGPELAAASAWCAGGAVLLATGVPAVPGADRAPWRFATPLATGLVAAAVAAGPGVDDLWVRVGSSVAGVLLAATITLVDRRPGLTRVRAWTALAAAAAACVLAGWPA